MLIMHALILDLVDSDFRDLFRARKKSWMVLRGQARRRLVQEG